MISCSLKPSPGASSSEKLGRQILEQLASHEVASSSVRAVDYNILPGVETDMGEGDDWPKLREKVLVADILVIVTPTWLGQHSSVAQRVLERLNADLGAEDEQGKPLMHNKVALVGVVGNEDGAHHITAILFQGLNDIGFTIAAQGSVYWNGEAMHKTDYQDLAETPEKVEQTMRAATAQAVRTATALRTA